MQAQLVAWRRDFHMHPELGFEEHRSAGIVAEQLRVLGYQVQTGIASTGVLGLLKGARPGPVLAARFDMDALPITEENEVEYASREPGLMHACGHDAHMAIGLGLATLMAQQRDEIAGTLMLIFQPGEEGMNGAEVMVKEGVLADPRPDVFLAAHVWSDSPVGTINVSSGPVMAAAERWACTVTGKGGHGALPHQTIDPIVAAAQIIGVLQTIVSRNVSPQETAVVTVGAIQGGDAFNVIPAQVTMSGTIRTYNPNVREMVIRRVREVVEKTAAACGAQANLNIEQLTPAVINDAEIAQIVHSAAETLVGADHVFSGERTMGSEDAAYFMEQVPGCYFFLGAGPPGQEAPAPHHNPRFDIDEAVLSIGVAILAQTLAYYLLRQ